MINFFNNKYYKIFLFRYVCSTIMENNTINILVIFGATGDLANRKIYPALNEIYKSDKLPENFQIIGGPNQSIKTSYVNGERSFSKTYSYFLQPLKKGSIRIKQASIEIDGEEYKSLPIEVRRAFRN